MMLCRPGKPQFSQPPDGPIPLTHSNGVWAYNLTYLIHKLAPQTPRYAFIEDDLRNRYGWGFSKSFSSAFSFDEPENSLTNTTVLFSIK